MNDNYQNICIHCGFCCDGTLFNHANIKESESIAPGYDFEIIPEEKRGFKQPCPYYNNNLCTIYDHRPYSVCESFRCKLLRSVISENVSYTDAVKIINELIGLKTKIELQILESHPENTGDSLPRKMKEFEAHFTETMGDVEFRTKFGHLLLDFFILRKKLSGSFRKIAEKGKPAE